MKQDEILKLKIFNSNSDIEITNKNRQYIDNYKNKGIFFNENIGFCKILNINLTCKRKKDDDDNWIKIEVIKNFEFNTTDDIMELASYAYPTDRISIQAAKKKIDKARTQFKKYKKQINLLA